MQIAKKLASPRIRVIPAGALMAAMVLVCAAAASADVQLKIVGGSTASTATYPWQSALVFNSAKVSGNAQQREFCGGSLLTSRIVITAGHCTWDDNPDPPCILVFCSTDQLHLDPDDVKVILGHDTLSTTPAGDELPVEAIYRDPNFNFSYGSPPVPRYDVAFLVLPSPSAQGQIKIAGSDEGALWDPGSYAEISGWGSTFDGGHPVDTLQAAAVTIFADSTCSADYPGDFDAATMTCAAGSGTDSCSGDSGGPLEAPVQGGGYRLVGLTGWGIGCGEPGHPGVYTRVAGPTMHNLIQADVNYLDATYGLPQEPIFGSTPTPSTKAKKKCKRIHNKKKRKRCLKKLKRKRHKKK